MAWEVIKKVSQLSLSQDDVASREPEHSFVGEFSLEPSIAPCSPNDPHSPVFRTQSFTGVEINRHSAFIPKKEPPSPPDIKGYPAEEEKAVAKRSKRGSVLLPSNVKFFGNRAKLFTKVLKEDTRARIASEFKRMGSFSIKRARHTEDNMRKNSGSGSSIISDSVENSSPKKKQKRSLRHFVALRKSTKGKPSEDKSTTSSSGKIDPADTMSVKQSNSEYFTVESESMGFDDLRPLVDEEFLYPIAWEHPTIYRDSSKNTSTYFSIDNAEGITETAETAEENHSEVNDIEMKLVSERLRKQSFM